MEIDALPQSEDRLEIGFLDHDKINGASNANFPQTLMIAFPNHALTGFLVDDRRSCNVLYADVVEQLGLHQSHLNKYYERDLITFNSYSPLQKYKYEIIVGRRNRQEKGNDKFQFVVIFVYRFMAFIDSFVLISFE